MPESCGEREEQEGENGDDGEINGVLPDAENVVGARQEREECIIPDEWVRKTALGFIDRTGYFTADTGYRLRPEVLESFNNAYPVTGDKIS